MSRSALLLVGASCLFACSKAPTSKAGPLGEVDLVPKLPAGVTPPPDSELKTSEAKHSICVAGKGDEPAEVRVAWKSFTKGDDGYITSYAVELTKTPSGLTVTLGKPASVSRAPKDVHLAVASIEVKCSRNSNDLIVDSTETIYVLSDGASMLKH